jgi:hypothetical protein
MGLFFFAKPHLIAAAGLAAITASRLRKEYAAGTNRQTIGDQGK